MTELGTIAAILIALIVPLEIGLRAGYRRASSGPGAPNAGQIGAVQGALLGMLGLLLGFSFAGAASRFLDRQDLITQEANAIGTAYLRADMLPEPHASRLRQALSEYLARRVEASSHLATGVTPAMLAEAATYHERMWQAARDGALARPDMAKVVLDPVNDVIDLHSTRLAAGRKHLPLTVAGLLFACSILSVGVISYGSGLCGARGRILNYSLALIVAASLWTTFDLDHARAGLIRLSDAPLKELSLHPPAAAPR